MPWLLLVPLLGVALCLLWALLLPVSLVLRYRHGKARRRVWPLAVRVNAWLLLASLPVFGLGVWVTSHWVAQAPVFALAGVAGGGVLGVIGLCCSRFETTPAGLHYTPPAWLLLLLTGLVAVRIGLGFWQGWQHWQAGAGVSGVAASQASLVAVAGLLLGYAVAYAWGLKRRLG